MRLPRKPHLAPLPARTVRRSRIRPGGQRGPTLLRIGLVLAIATIAVTWYRFDGYQILAPWLQGSRGSTSSAVNGLPTLHLEVQSRVYARIAEQHQVALSQGGIWEEDNDPAAAKLRFQEQRLAASVRLGEGPMVQQNGEYWSLEIEVQDPARLLDMRTFSAQPVDAERFLNDWWYAQSLRGAGILASRCALVNLAVNGDDWGLYVLREAFTADWLASQGRSGGAIVRLDERLLWERRAQLGQDSIEDPAFLDPIASTFELPAFAQVVEARSFLGEDGRQDRGQTEEALRLLRAFQERQMEALQVFDSELLGRYVAHANLWGARHGLMWYNAQYYYNPSTLRLEPIGHDARALAPEYAAFVDLAQYDDLAVMEAYAHEVARITRPDYLATLRAEHADSFHLYEAALASVIELEYAPWDAVAERQALLAAALHPLQSVHAYEEGRAVGDGLVIQVGNLLRYPVVLKQFTIGDRTLDIEPGWVVGPREEIYADAPDRVVLRSAKRTAPRYLSLHIPVDAIESLVSPSSLLDAWTIQIVTQLVGMEELLSVDVQPHYPPSLSLVRMPSAPSVPEALALYPFLEQGERPGFLALKAGTWQVAGNLTLPKGIGLEATQPITLAFEREAMLFATGPLWLQGPDRGGIHLVPQQESWAGLVVHHSDSEALSSLRNVEIRGAGGTPLRDGSLSAGATFYESPVVLERCRLVSSTAPDALHVVRAYLKVAQTEFGNISGDALDGNLVQGRVEGGVFHDVLGSGIAVDHSRVDVQDTSFVRIYDKAIAAGEGSLVSVQDVSIADTVLGIASSDLSHLRVHDLRLEQIWLAGLTAYQQAWAHGHSIIQATHLVSEGDVPIVSLVQPGHHILVDGVEANPSTFDAQALHWRDERLSGVQVLSHRFGDKIRLLGYVLDVSAVRAGEPARLVLYWQALGEVEREYTVFVHALDESGQLVAQWDAMPRENSYPTTHWLPGRVVDDPHVLVLPPDLAPGTYRLAVGMYFWQTGERLPIERLDRTSVPDGALGLKPTIEIG